MNDISADIVEHLNLTADDAFVARCAKWASFPGIPAERFRQRVIELPGGRVVFCGVRFYGTDRTRPFAEVVADTRPTEDNGLLAAEQALKAFDIFRPPAARLYAVDRPDFPDRWRVEADIHLVAATLEEIAAVTPPADVALDPIDRGDIELAMQMVNERYNELDDKLKRLIRPCSEEQLRDCQSQKLAFWFRDGSSTAGLLALRPEPCRHLGGLCVVEEITIARHRGKGIATAGQIAAAKQLIERFGPDAYLWGTIDDANTASLKTSQRAGRSIEGTWWFCYPPKEKRTV